MNFMNIEYPGLSVLYQNDDDLKHRSALDSGDLIIMYQLAGQ